MQEVLAGRGKTLPPPAVRGRETDGPIAAVRAKKSGGGKEARRRLQRGKRNRKRGNRISNLENTVSIPGNFEINLDFL